MQGKHQKNTQKSASFAQRARTAAQQAAEKGSTVSFADGFRAAGGKKPPSSHANRKPRKPRKTNPVKKAVNDWCNRLLGVVSEGSFDQEEEFASHKTTRDYICNTIGTGAWGMVFPILTIVVTQLCGVEQAGMFSMAFIIGTLLMIIGNYGMRTYQVSDIAESHSFSDYQISRIITCIVMMVVAYVYCGIRGYSEQMFTICMGVCVYKMVDGLADVYEGRLQQKDKLYLAGISQAFRSVVVFVVFSVLLLITRDLGLASIAMAVAAIVTFVVLTFPLALLETPKSRRQSAQSIIVLFKQCSPAFVALFMYALIDNMPKFVMETALSYDNQLYFNALYFPAQAILLTVGFVYKPLLVRMAQMWADAEKRSRFHLVILAIVALVIALTLVVIFFMGWIGIPIMSFMYGVDFEQFRGLSYIMIAAGGVTAIIDFLYQVITVLRRQKSVMKLYVITFGFSLFVPILLIDFTGLPGAVIGYLIVMTILLVLLVWEYISICIDLMHHPERAEAVAAAENAAAKAQAARSGAAARTDRSVTGEANGFARNGNQPRRAGEPGQAEEPVRDYVAQVYVDEEAQHPARRPTQPVNGREAYQQARRAHNAQQARSEARGRGQQASNPRNGNE